MSNSVLEGFRLSPQQRRLWRLGHEAAHGAGPVVRHARFRLRLVGSCDVASLRAALETVTARHEILRTRFRTFAGMALPVQDVQPEASVSFESFDLSGHPAEACEAQIRRREEELAGGPGEDTASFRSVLFRLSPDRHILSSRVPALCADPVALRNLASEIAEVYEARRAGRSWAADDSAQYADLSEFFNELVESEDSAEALAFWRRTDFELLDRQRLPFRPTGHPAPDFDPRKVELALPEESAAAVASLAESCGVSLSDFLLGLWMVLLGRLSRPHLSRRAPILVGRAFAGRNYEGLGEAVGLFARHLPIHLEIDDGEPLSRFLSRVREAVAEAEKRQEYFDWETVAPAALQERRSFFPLCFEERPPLPRWEAAGLVFELEEVEAYYDLFEVRLEVQLRPPGFTLAVVYDARRHDAAAAGHLAGALSALLESAAAGPGSPVGSLGMLSAGERRRLVEEWNPPASPRPFVAIHTQFEEQARRNPELVAVESAEGNWCYAELAAAADRLARELIAQGVGREQLVAVCLERTREVLVALLGVFKAGGAYLPLDPVSPPARQAAILEDAGAELVLTDEPWRNSLQGGTRTLILSEVLSRGERRGGHGGRDASSADRVDAESLAYVLYTSGSSGQPKGVMISHGALANYMGWVGDVLLSGREAAMPLVTRPSFDASLKQLFGPLIRGGRVCLLAPEVLDNPVGLLESLAQTREEVILNCVPSLWRVLINALETGLAPRPSRRVAAYLGGEALREDLLRRSFEIIDDLEVWNLYGPTEATANASAARLRKADPITLGRPVANARLYLLDPRLQPVAGGVAGEIYIGGAGLARGYRRRPSATAQSFLPDPVSGVPGARLYRSGDLARFQVDGALEFLGRIDQQVKLRGYRIELEEIETVLRRHPAVAETAAVLQNTAAGEPRLLTFVVPREGAMPDGHDLAVFLAAELPEYMVPAYFLMWPELPRTAGGKVDRQQLAAVDPAGYDLREPYVEPRTPLEKELAEIWGRLLGQEGIGLKDNFYHRGGHSLVAIRILSEVQRVFGIAVPLAVILETDSLEAMAAAIDEARREAGAEEEADG